MSLLRFVLNVLWLICGGFVMALVWAFIGVIAVISIVGIPFARSCFVIAQLTLWPFGKDIQRRDLVHYRQDVGTGSMGTVGNVIWFLLFGLWLALAHLFHAVACIITIIGIPFGIQHIKLAMLSIAPIGQTVVELD